MSTPRENLKNLAKIGRLIPEPPSQTEFDAMMRSGRLRFPDSENGSLHLYNRFMVAYDAAHTFALAALRWHGYRSKDRATVFQVLEHTAGLSQGEGRFLYDCHQKRNLALYEGGYHGDERVVTELIAVTKVLMAAVERMGPVP